MQEQQSAAGDRRQARRVTLAVAAAGICSFALLYAPQPLLPQLAAEFGLDPGRASLSIGFATGALALAVLPIAALSEVIGRRPVIVTSVLASVALGVLLSFAPNYPVFLVLRVLQGVAIAGFPGVAAAYLTEQLGPPVSHHHPDGGATRRRSHPPVSHRHPDGGATRRRSHAIGVAAAVGAMIAGNTVGGMTGRLAAGFTTDLFGWRGALGAVTGVALLCALLTVLLLPRSTRQRADNGATSARGLVAGMGASLRAPVLLVQYSVALLAMGSFVALYNAAGFRLTGAPLELSPAIAALVYLAYAMGAVSSGTAGRLVGRFGRVRSLVAALLITVAGAALTLPDSLPMVVAGFVVLTGGFFAAHAVANGWAAAEAPAQARGQVSGMYTLAYYLGSSIGGTVGTAVYGHAGWGPLVAVTACWLGLAGLGVLLFARR
ncbi:MFS transporter [Amycolatopsis marina]|uniref:MFS transporter n=1 Tax=Amycolatopsis marina TaxID=490629 RepID=UPI001FE2C99D|nr:MFS transporter [Amycolatopsis marina]